MDEILRKVDYNGARDLGSRMRVKKTGSSILSARAFRLPESNSSSLISIRPLSRYFPISPLTR